MKLAVRVEIGMECSGKHDCQLSLRSCVPCRAPLPHSVTLPCSASTSHSSAMSFSPTPHSPPPFDSSPFEHLCHATPHHAFFPLLKPSLHGTDNGAGRKWPLMNWPTKRHRLSKSSARWCFWIAVSLLWINLLSSNVQVTAQYYCKLCMHLQLMMLSKWNSQSCEGHTLEPRCTCVALC